MESIFERCNRLADEAKAKKWEEYERGLGEGWARAGGMPIPWRERVNDPGTWIDDDPENYDIFRPVEFFVMKALSNSIRRVDTVNIHDAEIAAYQRARADYRDRVGGDPRTIPLARLYQVRGITIDERYNRRTNDFTRVKSIAGA